MSVGKNITREESWRANVEYHNMMLSSYGSLPHFRRESVKRVQNIIGSLARRTGGGSLLDLGCGTGFVINIALKYFDHVYGADICKKALAKIRKSPKIELIECPSEKLPFTDGSFNVVTGFSLLHHLYDIRPTLKEAHRVLKKGGMIYFDDEPNREYFLLMRRLNAERPLPSILRDEVERVLNVERALLRKNGIKPELTHLAEYQKLVKDGFSRKDVAAVLSRIGFRNIDFRYRWFLGQRKLEESSQRAHAAHLEKYLQAMLPATESFFKYFWFTAIKK